MDRVHGMILALAVVAVILAAGPVGPQQMQHDHSMSQPASLQSAMPTLPGQDAFGAIAEIVRILEADPATDWSKVNLERLRQHLVDMNEVTLRSEVKSDAVPGGLAMDVTGTGRTEQAIHRMVMAHTAELNKLPEWSAKTEPVRGGLRLTVTAKNPDDTKTVLRIRGLGLIGLLTVGAHHQLHHLAMARGEAMAGHGH